MYGSGTFYKDLPGHAFSHLPVKHDVNSKHERFQPTALAHVMLFHAHNYVLFNVLTAYCAFCAFQNGSLFQHTVLFNACDSIPLYARNIIYSVCMIPCCSIRMIIFSSAHNSLLFCARDSILLYARDSILLYRFHTIVCAWFHTIVWIP